MNVTKLRTPSLVTIKTGNTGGGLNPTSVTLTGGGSSVTTRLDQLDDVSEVSPANGQTLVYQSNNDTYVVQYINVDGGTF